MAHDTSSPKRTFSLIFALALVCAHSWSLGAEVTPEQIDASINKAIAYLYNQEKDGNWETNPAPNHDKNDWSSTGAQWGGRSALVTYALLAAGENPQDDRLAQAITWLQNADMKGIYALGLRANVWEQLPQTPAIKQCITRDGDLIIHGIRTKGPTEGLYDYTTNPRDEAKQSDHSVSQYGVLGAWASAESDLYEISDAYWQLVEKAWIRDQDPSGGWAYGARNNNTDPVNGSMTAAGIATLFITQEYLHSREQGECHGNYNNPHIDAGMKWMADHFKDAFAANPFYTWYGVSRIGVASGFKYFGSVNWFKDGAARIIAAQGADGGWGGDKFINGSTPPNVPNTCFCLLFLVRGRAPVFMNKLQYQLDEYGDTAKAANWNERSRDAAHLAKWAGKQSESFFNWQILSLQAPMDELHESPILYIAGDRQGLSFTRDEEAKLKQFVEEGGTIVGNADCDSHQFAEAFRKLGTRLFPASEFRKLPNDHILFHNQFDRRHWTDGPEVEGLSNGAREMMILLPRDPARYWQVRTVAGHESTHQFMLNLWMYVTDKSRARYKGDTYVLTPNGSAASRTLKVARLKYAGNWDPEPGGWRRMAAYMHNVNGTDLAVDTVELGAGKLGDYKIAHFTGTFKFALTAAQQDEIRKFVEAGGTLIVDSCGGTREFTDAAQHQLQEIFGAPAGQLSDKPLAVDSPVFQSAAVKIAQVGYRKFAARVLGGKKDVLLTPRLRSITVNGRIAVLFSPEDLSEGLVGQPLDGIYGYIPLAAKTEDGRPVAGCSEIMASLLMFADGHASAAPATQPQPTTVGQPQ